jgi:hypothetical protein
MVTLNKNFGAELLEIAFVIYLQLQAYVKEENSADSCAVYRQISEPTRVCHLSDNLSLSLCVDAYISGV